MTLAAAIVVIPSQVRATAPPTDGPSAGELFRDGQARADAADYKGAIIKFEEAFALLPDEEANEGTRNRLRVELVRAHEKAFDIDGDMTHLTKAKVLLEDYRSSLDPGETENVEWADAQHADIEEKLAQIRADAEAARAAAEAEQAEEEEEPSPALEISPPGQTPVDAPPPDPKAGSSLIVAGGILGGLGVGSAIMMAAGLAKANNAVDTFETEPAKREKARNDNQLGNTLGIAGGVAAGVFLTAGAVLIALGVKKKQNNRRTAVAPMINSEQIGAVLRARF